MLEFILDNLDAVPEALRHLYKQRGDGKYVLQVNGAVPEERFREFRDKNIELLKEADKFKDVDPAKYRELLQIETDLRNGKLKDGKTVEQIVEERTATMKAAFETEKGTLTKQIEGTTAELAKLKISDAALAVAVELGLRPTAKEDLVERVTKVFKLKDGKPVAYGPDGQEIYGPGAEPLSVRDYVSGLTEKAAHLFEPSNGTGAAGNGAKPPGRGPVVNPWKKETFNLTKQGEMYAQNKEQAIRLAAEAGVKLT